MQNLENQNGSNLPAEAAGHIEGVSVLSSTPLPVFLYADIWSALKHFWVIFLQGRPATAGLVGGH